MAVMQTTPLISNFMRTLRDEYGFDTLAARRMALRSMNPSDAGSQVLDVGTGSGWMAILATEQGHHVVSIDPDARGLIRAKDRAGQALKRSADRLHFVRADALRMPFRENHFDAVFSFDVVHHFVDWVCPEAIREMIRVCKPGGDIIIADLNEGGLDAVRSVHARAGLQHEENRCGVQELGLFMRDVGLRTTRKDTPFVAIFHARK